MYISNSNRFTKFEILNRNALKYLVIIFMLLDHISYFFPPTNSISLFIGIISRLTAPTMALSIAEGYYYTRNLKKYMKRMFIFSVISYIPYVLYRTECILPIQLFSGSAVPMFYREFGALVPEPHVYLSFINSTLVIHETSVIFTLFLGLVTIYLWDKVNIPKIFKLAITLLILYITAFSNWHYYLILLCLIFYFLKDNPRRLWFSFFIVSLLYIFEVRLFRDPFHFSFTMHFIIFAIGILLVPLFLLFYNGKSGKKSSFNKWFFYIFYPSHLLIIGIFRILIG